MINYYWKYPKQNEKHPNYSYRELSDNVIRFEVQCKYPKLYSLTRDICAESKFYVCDLGDFFEEIYEKMVKDMHKPSIPIDVVLADEVSENVVCKHFYRVIRKGDYFTLDGAKHIVESYYFRRDKEERLINALESVKKYHGIAKAKTKLYGLDLQDFKRSLRDLDDIQVNPVTIPRRWGIKYIPNLFRAYDDAAYEVT